MGIRNMLRNWLLEDKPSRTGTPVEDMIAKAPGVYFNPRAEDHEASTRFALIKASNGYVVEQSNYKPNPRGPDWTHTMHIVKDGETPASVIERLLVIKQLEK